MGRIFTKEQREKYKNLIEYPQKFIDKCLSIYKEDEEIKELLEEKSFLINAVINSIVNKQITSSEIVEAYRNDNIDEIVQMAYKIELCKDLQKDFMKLYDEQYRSKGKYIKDGKVYNNAPKLVEYRKPVSVKPVPGYKMSPSCKAALEYNENCQAAGRIAAENYIAGGGIKPESSEPGGALEKKYSK